jgi:hypothetical protein
VLRYEAVPTAAFSTDTLKFIKVCPGNTSSQSMIITNSGTGVLLIDSIRIRTAAGSPVTYTGSAPSGINASSSSPLVIQASVAANAAPGTYYDTLRIYSNDGNYSGPNRIKLIFLATTVGTKTIVLNLAAPLDAGNARPVFTKTISFAGAIRNPSECSVTITSATFVRGTEFSLQTPISGTVLPNQTIPIPIYFNPTGLCTRRDTLVVTYNMTGSPLRIPFVGTGVEPGFATDPIDTIDFGNVVVGSPLDGLLKIANRKAGSCLDSTRIIGFDILPNNLDFSTSFTIGGPTYLQPNSEIAITITAKPSTLGIRRARAVITHEILGGSRADTVVLVVNGVQPSLTAVKNDITFARTDVGGYRDSTVRNFLQNQSLVDVQIRDITITGANSSDFLYSGPTAFTIAKGTSKTIDLRFRPSATGARQATLELTTDIPSTIRILLSGPAERPIIGKGRSQIVFDPVDINDCHDSIVQHFLFNTGNVPLRITGTHIGGKDSMAFSVVDPTIPPDTLMILPGDSAALTLRFCAKHTDVHNAILSLTNNSDSTPVVIQLVGAGNSAQVVSGDTVSFGSLRVLTTRDSTLKRLIFNPQEGRLDITSIRVIGADANSFQVLSSPGPFSIEKSRDSSVDIRFNPMRRGRHSGMLEIVTASLGTFYVPLLGQAIFPFLEIRPGDPTNLRVPLGSTRKLQIDITNSGDDSARIEKATLNGSPAFSNVSTGLFPARLMPGESLAISVDFTPDSNCEHLADVQLQGEGVRGTYALDDTTVRFAGVGIAPLVTTRSDEISFGSRLLNSQNDSTLGDFLGNRDFTGMIGVNCLEGTSIDSMTITGSGAASFSLIDPVDPLSSRQLPADSLLPFTIRFKPVALGLNSAELHVHFNGSSDSTRIIRLLGSGSVLPIEYGPVKNMIRIDFGKVHLDMSRDSSFTATNISDAPLTIDAITTSHPSEFIILSPTTFPITMQPHVPITITAQFAPRDTLGQREALVQFHSGNQTDSSFGLAGIGAGDALRSIADTIDFGARPAGSINDTNVVLLNEATVAFPDTAVLGAVVIDEAAITSGQGSFELVRSLETVEADSRDSLLVRFRASGTRGRREGVLRVYYNRRAPAGVALRDSLDIILRGAVGGENTALELGLGADQDGVPGTNARFPITLTGDLAEASISDLDLIISYNRMMLRPLKITAAGSDVTATLDSSVAGRAHIHLTGSRPFTAGTVADLDFRVLLGDSLETIVRYDSAAVAGRTDLLFTTRSARFSIANFCNAQRRLIRFDNPLKLISLPNPSTGAITIEYTLPAITDVQLSIYDESGKEINRLTDGIGQPGHYSVPLDMSDCGDGIFYCMLTAGRFTQTLTLHILK